MSGDLRDPKKSIPRGTMAAIIVGAIVYFSLAVFFAYRVEREPLLNPSVLVSIAAFGPAVIAGIWGATLSSAIGSILGAPRILQALSIDRIMPRFFAKGSGKTNEPRNALILAFAIGEGGILIGELDVIARVVSMVFLATYGFLNLSCAIESWASPDFRPDFRIPRTVSIVGAITCMLVMIQLDLAAMAGATVIMVGLFAILKRRELHLDAGDTWEGIWSSIVRAGLHRLARSRGQRRNWRPNVLLFAHEGSEARPRLVALATQLVGGNGMLTDFRLHTPEKSKKPPDADEEEPPLGTFIRRTPCENVHETVQATCRFHGFSGLHPNAVLLDWEIDRKEPDRFADTLRTAAELDFNLMLLAQLSGRDFGDHDTIDVWWRPKHGNVPLSLAIVRYLTRFEPWQGARIRFVLVSRDSAENDTLRAAMRALLLDARVEASIKVITLPGSGEGLRNAVLHESAYTSLTILGLADDLRKFGKTEVERLDELATGLGPTLFLRGSSMFPEVMPVSERAATAPRAAISQKMQRAELELPELAEPDHRELGREANRFCDAVEGAVRDFHERGILQALERDHKLVEGVRDLVKRHFEILRRGVADGAARARKPVARAQGGFLFQGRKQLADFEADHLTAQKASIDGRVESCLAAFERIVVESPATLRVVGRKEAFEPHPDDTSATARFKRWRRFLAAIQRLPVAYEVPLSALVGHHARVPALELLKRGLERFESTSHRTAVHLGKILNAAVTDLAAITAAAARGEQDADDVDARMKRVLENLDECAAAADERGNADHRALLEETRELSQRFALDLDNVDVARVVKKYRANVKEAKTVANALKEQVETWHRHQALLVQRAQLGLLLAGFHHRFTAVANKAKNDVALEIRGGALAAIDELTKQFTAFLEDLDKGGEPELHLDLDFGARFSARDASDHLTRDVIASTEDLPETRTTISDEAIQEIEGGTHADVEELTVSVRPLVQYLIESEFAATVNRELSGIPAQEQRALGTAHDVTRLVEFSLGDLDAMGGWKNEAFRTQMTSVVRSGLERLEEERKELTSNIEKFEATVDRKVQTVVEGTDPYHLTTHTDNLTMYIRSREGKKAVSRVRDLARRGVDAVRGGAVKLMYRRSAGVLLARRLARREAGGGDAVLDRAVRLSRTATPPQRILGSLPFYYRQLFSGQATISETFWVGREEQLEAGKTAARAHGQGAHGAIFVTGETGSGKTALCRVMVTKMAMKRKLFRIVPPPGGSIEPSVFKRIFENEVKSRGKWNRVLGSIPDGSVVMLDDFEMWWERHAGGLAVVEQTLELIEKYGGRILFLINLNRHAYRLLNRFVRLGERALTLVECEPVSAENLKSIITVRHASTGFRYRLGRTEEEDLAPWRQARLFTPLLRLLGRHGWARPCAGGWRASSGSMTRPSSCARPRSWTDP